jgi:hypothetical protein
MPMLHLDQLNHRWVSPFLIARIEDENHEAFRLKPPSISRCLAPIRKHRSGFESYDILFLPKIIIGGIWKDHIRGEIRSLESRNSRGGGQCHLITSQLSSTQVIGKLPTHS